jgi:hypothetical protein
VERSLDLVSLDLADGDIVFRYRLRLSGVGLGA